VKDIWGYKEKTPEEHNEGKEKKMKEKDRKVNTNALRQGWC